MGYMRLVRRYDSIEDKETERRNLLVLLATIPCISDVVLHGEHPKGGYRIGCTIEKDGFDSFISAIEGDGWMLAI
jgi:hypothetical protein